LGACWADGEADWTVIEQLLDYGDDLNRLIAEIAGENVEQLHTLRARVGLLLADAPDMLGAEKAVGGKLKQFERAWNELASAEDDLKRRIDFQEAVPLLGAGYVE